jgi:hypothetical protein
MIQIRNFVNIVENKSQFNPIYPIFLHSEGFFYYYMLSACYRDFIN